MTRHGHSNLVFALILKATAHTQVKQYAYLDDLTYSSTSWKSLQGVARKLTETLNALQMTVNVKKYSMVCDTDVIENIELQGCVVPKTQTADLLGMHMHMDISETTQPDGDTQASRSDVRWDNMLSRMQRGGALPLTCKRRAMMTATSTAASWHICPLDLRPLQNLSLIHI
eukprot:2870408-Amphidinium_carterae.1